MNNYKNKSSMDPTLVWKWSVRRDEGPCAVCTKMTTNRCTRCKTVHYCTKDHQTLHWKSDHKKNCGVIELAVDPIIGRHYIAKRRIEPGEVVVSDKKMLVTFGNNQTEHPLCLNCYTDVTDEDSQRICSQCGWWPLCLNCTQHGAECKFTIEHGRFEALEDDGKSIKQNWDVQNCLFLGVIRVLALRVKKPKVYSKILNGDDSELKWRAMANSTVDICLGDLIKTCYNLENLQESEIAKIARILYINGVEYRSGVSGIADKTTFFEHSCHSNCSFTISDKVNGGLVVWAVKEIAPGEHVSIPYYDPTDGTMIRKERLLKSRFFECPCQRCEDPTEFGTMFNAIKCTVNTCEDYMLPPSFSMSDDEKHSDFVCLKCKTECLWDDVVMMHREIEAHLFSIHYFDVNGFKSFIEDYEEVLHTNHYLMIKAKLSLANVLGFDAYYDPEKPNVSMDELNEKIKLSEEMVKFLDLLMPGYTIGRGRLLYGIGVSLSRKIKETDDSNELRILLPKTCEILTEACKLLCYEEEDSGEGQIAKQSFQMLLLLIITTEKIANTEL